jgi:eukaryotic-like serine/threonine-protein kinase
VSARPGCLDHTQAKDQPDVESFGKYTLIERVAVGGMAEIYKAKTTGMSGFERVVAIKRLHHHLSQDAELAQMLVDEAKIAVLLNHPNVGQVFDLGQVNGLYFMVMEYIDGPDLHRVLRKMREQQLYCPIPLALHIIAEACAGLDFAHNIHGHDGHPLQLVHRDVSPQNIMLTTSGEVKLVDFGIAKARLRMMETQAGIIKGKFYYMAPEQAYGQRLDARTDVFAIGMVLYEALVGRAAYEDSDDVSLLKRARSGEYPAPTALRPDLDPALEAIVVRALQREPQHRYQSARELQGALRQYIAQRYGEVDRYKLAEFVQQIIAQPVSTSGKLPLHVPAQQVMERKDYKVSDESLIYRGPIPESTEPTHSTHFAEGMLQDYSSGQDYNNVFEDDGPTYVYSRDEDNPFAIPDVLNSPSQDATAPVYQPLPSFPTPDRALPSGFSAAPPQPRAPDQRAPAMAPHRPTMAEASVTRRFNLASIPPNARIAAGAVAALFVGGLLLVAIFSGSDDKESEASAAVKPIPEVEAPPAPKYQTVSVNSAPPNAQVFLDGAFVGTTPMALPELEIGRTYKLKVTSKSRPVWEQELVVAAEHPPIAVDFSTLAAPGGVLKIVTHPADLRVEVDGAFVGKSPTEVVDLSRDEDHTIVALREDGTKLKKVVSWLDDEPDVKSVELAFEEEETPTNALPKPPEVIKQPVVKKKYTPPPRKKTTKPREEPEEEPLLDWGKDKKKPAEPKPKKKPAKKADDEEPLLNW